MDSTKRGVSDISPNKTNPNSQNIPNQTEFYLSEILSNSTESSENIPTNSFLIADEASSSSSLVKKEESSSHEASLNGFSNGGNSTIARNLALQTEKRLRNYAATTRLRIRKKKKFMELKSSIAEMEGKCSSMEVYISQLEADISELKKILTNSDLSAFSLSETFPLQD